MTSRADVEVSLEQIDDFREQFLRDGILIIKNAFDEKAMGLIEEAYEERLSNLADYSRRFYPESGTFLQSVDDSSKKPTFQAMYANSPIVKIARAIFGSDNVWHYEDQLFFKEGGKTPSRRTPWHQDTSYHPISGENIAVFWMPMQDITDDTALEVIPRTHTGQLYNGSVFDPSDDTAPLYNEKDMPRLPDIQAEREKWDIVTCSMNKGDVLIFHTSALHGGGGTPPGGKRRSLSLRLIGDGVVRIPRPRSISEESGEQAAGYEGEYDLQTRIKNLPIGEDVYKAGLTRL